MAFSRRPNSAILILNFLIISAIYQKTIEARTSELASTCIKGSIFEKCAVSLFSESKCFLSLTRIDSCKELDSIQIVERSTDPNRDASLREKHTFKTVDTGFPMPDSVETFGKEKQSEFFSSDDADIRKEKRSLLLGQKKIGVNLFNCTFPTRLFKFENVSQQNRASLNYSLRFHSGYILFDDFVHRDKKGVKQLEIEISSSSSKSLEFVLTAPLMSSTHFYIDKFEPSEGSALNLSLHTADFYTNLRFDPNAESLFEFRPNLELLSLSLSGMREFQRQAEIMYEVGWDNILMRFGAEESETGVHLKFNQSQIMRLEPIDLGVRSNQTLDLSKNNVQIYKESYFMNSNHSNDLFLNGEKEETFS